MREPSCIVATQDCDDLPVTLHDQMFGDCSDERMAEELVCESA